MRQRELLILHLGIWFCYFLGTWFSVDYYWCNEANGSFDYWIHWLCSRLGDVFFVYLFYNLAYKIFFSKSRYVFFGIVFCLIGFLHYAYDTLVWNWFDWSFFWFGYDGNQRLDIVSNVSTSSMVSLIFYLAYSWSWSYKRGEKLNDEVAETELKFLKSQMSPHFLFNVLNNIYSLSLDDNNKTPQAIKQLESIMSYIKIFEMKDAITLGQEYKYLRSYIELNALRFPVNVSFHCSILNPNLNIEAMIFLPFFENAYKHGKTGKEHNIYSSLTEENGIIKFQISNEIDLKKKKDNVSGVGMENLRKRLPYFYKDFSIDIKNDNKNYKATIQINIDKRN